MSVGFDPHLTRIQLRQELARLIKQKFGERMNFSPICGLKESHLSKIFRHKQCMRLAHLDAMTAALGLPEGHFYHLYKGDCFQIMHRRPHPRNAPVFIRKCLQRHKADLAYEVLTLMLEYQPVQSATLLRQAEELYDSLSNANLLPFYSAVIEKDEQVTEQMVIAHYRQFLILRRQGIKGKATGALYRLLPHLNLLPRQYHTPSGNVINLHIDAYRHVLLYFQQIEEWDDLLHYANELEKWAVQDEDDEALGEARRYQEVALERQSKQKIVKESRGAVV